MTKDLTKGNIPKLLLGFLIPIIFGKLFQQIYGVVDAAIVGRTLGVGRRSHIAAARRRKRASRFKTAM